jgi:hypothetical protein
MSTVALKVVTTKRPSGKVIGYRIVLAHLNKAAYAPDPEGDGEYVQSFVPKYRICESSDYTKITPEILEQYLARVQAWHNIDHVIPFG